MEKPTWKNTLHNKASATFPCKNEVELRELALKCKYPYFIWGNNVWETESGVTTGWRVNDVDAHTAQLKGIDKAVVNVTTYIKETPTEYLERTGIMRLLSSETRWAIIKDLHGPNPYELLRKSLNESVDHQRNESL